MLESKWRRPSLRSPTATHNVWRKVLSAHGLACSMSRHGNCRDSAPVQSFYGLPKQERVKCRIYRTMNAARADVFDGIEMFCNPKRRHGSNGDLPPVGPERRYAQRRS